MGVALLVAKGLLVGAVQGAGRDSEAAKRSHDSANRWKHYPVVVGNTGGTGARGVVELLSRFGLYMAPPAKGLLFDLCYSAEQLDNYCMMPLGSTLDVSEPYSGARALTAARDYKQQSGKQGRSNDKGLNGKPVNAKHGVNLVNANRQDKDVNDRDFTWLQSGKCLSPNKTELRESEGISRYLTSVPGRNQLKYRWGWKSPRTAFEMAKLFAVYPGLLFVHAVRSPLDIASDTWSHLKNRAMEFSIIHGGYEETSELLEERCTSIYARQTRSTCELSPQALKEVSECTGKSETCARKFAPEKGAWRCLQMMLWSETNSALNAFGQRCLAKENRYVLWNVEDGVGLRGRFSIERLEASLASALGIDLNLVQEAFHSFSTSKPRDDSRQRKLMYGKYEKTGIDVNKSIQCSEAAVPGTFGLLGYTAQQFVGSLPI